MAFGSLFYLLVDRSGARICKCPESRQMASLVLKSEPPQNYLVRAGFRFLFLLVAQEDPQIATCGAVV